MIELEACKTLAETSNGSVSKASATGKNWPWTTSTRFASHAAHTLQHFSTSRSSLGAEAMRQLSNVVLMYGEYVIGQVALHLDLAGHPLSLVYVWTLGHMAPVRKATAQITPPNRATVRKATAQIMPPNSSHRAQGNWSMFGQDGGHGSSAQGNCTSNSPSLEPQ